MGRAPSVATHTLWLLTSLYPICMLESVASVHWKWAGLGSAVWSSLEFTSPLGRRSLILSHW